MRLTKFKKILLLSKIWLTEQKFLKKTNKKTHLYRFVKINNINNIVV